jgi:hypothetical protein
MEADGAPGGAVVLVFVGPRRGPDEMDVDGGPDGTVDSDEARPDEATGDADGAADEEAGFVAGAPDGAIDALDGTPDGAAVDTLARKMLWVGTGSCCTRWTTPITKLLISVHTPQKDCRCCLEEMSEELLPLEIQDLKDNTDNGVCDGVGIKTP